MPGAPSENEILAELVAWGEQNNGIRALILTSSRARRDGTADDLSDYDVIVAVRDPETFLADEAWAEARGRPLVSWGDEHELLESTASFRGAVYADGVKVDFTIWPDVLLDRVATADTLPDALDVGYLVLIDKDARTPGWRSPTFTAHVPARPTSAEFEALVDEFWWTSTYAAKALWRGEIVFAKFVLDVDLKLGSLRRLLEWRVELDHDWRVRPGVFGRGLEQMLPEDVAGELLDTYVGSSVADNWAALFRTTALFRRVATEVARALGFRYPVEADDGVTALLEEIRARSPGEASVPARRRAQGERAAEGRRARRPSPEG